MANVIVSGLTAAGKTTHSRILIAEYGFEYVSAGSMIKEAADVSSQSPDYWITCEGKQVSKSILKFGVDQRLVERESRSDLTVFDCLSLPWLRSKNSFAIWLDSTLSSRVMKSAVSLGKDECSDSHELETQIAEKDQNNRDLLQHEFGFDIFDPFNAADLVLDISSFISEATRVASWKSIKQSHELVSSAVGIYLTGDQFYHDRFQRLWDLHGCRVIRKCPSSFRRGGEL